MKRILSMTVVAVLGLTARDVALDSDIFIRNGQIVDGSGDPGFRGDVGIIGHTVVETSFPRVDMEPLGRTGSSMASNRTGRSGWPP